MQNITYSEQALELQALAKEIAEKHVRPHAARLDKAQEYNYEAAQACAEAGLFGTWIPKEYGGQGAGVLALALVVEEMAKADSGFGNGLALAKPTAASIFARIPRSISSHSSSVN